MNRSVAANISTVAILTALSACQFVGPSSIRAGRLDYNEVIQRTSKEQTFANIVRVYDHEPTTFVDVNQVSATVQFQGVAMGGVTNIGLTKAGSANLSLQYQESPTVQYQPLSGAALIAQLATPITIESLGNLFNSDWPLASTLTFTVDRLTPGFLDYYAAINALIALDSVGAVTLTPGLLSEDASSTSEMSKNGTKSSGASQKAADKTNHPVLIIRLQPQHPGEGKFNESAVQKRIRDLWCRLTSLLEGTTVPCASDRPLILHSKPSITKKQQTLPIETPQVFTRSAYGVLQGAVEGAIESSPGEIAVVKEAVYSAIRRLSWNSDKKLEDCDSTSFYTITPTIKEQDTTDVVSAKQQVEEILQKRSRVGTDCLYTATESPSSDLRTVTLERQLARLRKFLLIITSDQEPLNSYVSYFDGRQWYYIDKDDKISQRNFLLIGQILVIQATTTPPLSLAPTISVGPK
jgi:hypothetical protein